MMTDGDKLMGKQLRAAGWRKVGQSDTWQSSNTGICLKRKKAWQLMLARRVVMGFAHEITQPGAAPAQTTEGGK